MNYDIADEILSLAEQLIGGSKKESPLLEKCKEEYEKAKSLMSQDRKVEGINHAVKIYQKLYY